MARRLTAIETPIRVAGTGDWNRWIEEARAVLCYRLGVLAVGMYVTDPDRADDPAAFGNRAVAAAVAAPVLRRAVPEPRDLVLVLELDGETYHVPVEIGD